MGDGPNDQGLSRHHVIRGAEASLRRLGTDWIDLYQVHEWDGATPLEETLAALDHLVQSGKVRYIGASNYTAWQLMKAIGVSERLGLARFVSQQVHYTLQARDIETELVPVSIDQGLGILVWSPIAGGLLSGKYRPRRRGARGQQAPRRVGRAARVRPGEALRHRRGAGRGRRGARRLRGAGRAGLAAGPPCRHVAHRRARAPRSSSPTTSPPPSSPSPTTSSPASTR
jgi:aryl-alcohol dehydrogenase-like predicted oxidoreductase